MVLLAVLEVVLEVCTGFEKLLVLSLSFFDCAAEVSNSLAHHHFLGECASFQELFQIFMVNCLTIWSSSYTLIVLNFRNQKVNITSLTTFVLISQGLNS